MAKYEPDECERWKSKTLKQIEEGEVELASLQKQILECLPNANTQALKAILESVRELVSEAKEAVSPASFS